MVTRLLTSATTEQARQPRCWRAPSTIRWSAFGRFEVADGSTIVLDEIGDLPQDLQVKLLRVLQDHVIERLGTPHPIKVNVRVIAATHIDLEQAVAEGRFREDLYYRLNVFPIRVPPLRERAEDIPTLVWAFVQEFSTAFGKRVESVSRQSLQALQAYPWPGNVRELRNVVERALVLANGPHLAIDPPTPTSVARRRSLKLVEVEVDHIRSVLETTGWRIRGVGGAADLLGMKPTTLESRMARLGITRHAQATSARRWPAPPVSSDVSIETLTTVVVPLILAAVMTAVGMDLRGDFARLRREPGLVLTGLLLPPLVLPFVAMGLVAAFAPPPAVAVGLLLIAACPVGGISNTFAYLAGASTSLSVTLTALSCVLGIVSIPALGLLYGRLLHQSLGLQVPLGALLTQLVVAVVAPVSVGMAIRHRWPAGSARSRARLRQLASALLLVLLVLTVATDVPGFFALLPTSVPIAAAFVVLSSAVGATAGRLVTRDPRARATLAIEFATRNVGIAATIAVVVLGRVEYSTFATAYFLTELPVMLVGVVLIRRVLATRPATGATTVNC